MSLIKCVKQSILARWDGKSPLLLGWSGGPDSTALLHALLELGIKPLLAHVDHGWREESQKEAEALQKHACDLGLTFFTTRLQLSEKNLEDASRKERQKFFQTICAAEKCQALLLAHHGDDQMETCLQRLFEGAHLPFLGGIREVQNLLGMEIWRPLLKASKADILLFLQERQILYLEDPSNLQDRFLRGRIRTAMPTLEQIFQKKFQTNLAHLAERAEELRTFLEKRTEQAHYNRRVTQNSIDWDVSGLERVEARYLLQRSLRSIPRTILEPLLDAAFAHKKRKRFFTKDQEWIVNGPYISYTSRHSKIDV